MIHQGRPHSLFTEELMSLEKPFQVAIVVHDCIRIVFDLEASICMLFCDPNSFPRVGKSVHVQSNPIQSVF